MLVDFASFVFVAGLFNCGLYILSVKWKLWQRIKIKPCVFCVMFWISMIEFFVILSLSMWEYSLFVSLATAAAGAFISANTFDEIN